MPLYKRFLQHYFTMNGPSKQFSWVGARKYQDSSARMSPSLMRARQQYSVRNAITGIVLGAFVFGVYTYSVRAVKIDDFSDVPVPPVTEEVLAELKREQELAKAAAAAAAAKQK
ncbi:uncharacterized protein V1516DRAFT_680215 [Lipomyces oligophaga]|uniref:uncharacterized protein n=1 Tax=Lipomyces oligophaga TaxID=45792 RepID=UPI0034CDC4E0